MSKIVDYQAYPFGNDRAIAPLISGEGARAYYRQGFLACAQDSARTLLGRSGTNVSAMPVLYLYRHYIELALKDILSAGGTFAIEFSDRKFGHDLARLWAEARKIFANFGMHELPALDDAIAELVELDDRADAFRYAIDRNDAPQFDKLGAVRLPVLIDTLAEIAAQIETLFETMDMAEAEMDEQIAWALDRDRS